MNIIERPNFLDLYTIGTCPSGADGYCDWFNNNHGCNFDDGDCCLTEADCTFCHSDECSCHETGLSNCIGEFGKSSFGCHCSLEFCTCFAV